MALSAPVPLSHRSSIAHELLDETVAYAHEYLEGLDERRVGWTASALELHQSLGGPLPEEPRDPREVIRELIEAVEPGLAAYGSGRYFGFVMGGATPASRAADWLSSTWDQCPGLYGVSPAGSVVEDVAGSWAAELLGLPASVSYGFVTGTQMANFTAMAAARHHLLREAGWDAETDGLQGAPRLRVIAGAERHVSVDRAVRFLGVGTRNLISVPAGDQGEMRVDGLADALAGCDRPTIVCAQAGNIHTGAFDPFGEICELADRVGAWVHIDGAFGLWAATSGRYRRLLDGFEQADSWAVDAHKWLNVPYDCGLVFTAHPEAHRGAMGTTAGYFIRSEESLKRDGVDWNPELSKRARALSVYAAIRELGRAGIAEMIERCCAHARLFAELLGNEAGVEVLNDVVLNQVLVRFFDDDARTAQVVERVQDDGTCWVSGSSWEEREVMRISVCNGSTTTDDVRLSAEAIIGAARSVGGS
jgi:glutamate/tyrosine decarboxylase-like PLP-dependent enzyme